MVCVAVAAASATVLGGARSARHASYAEGAPPGFSGGFTEESCHACHFHEAVNAAPGRVTIAGVPPRFAAGERYELTVTLARTDMKLAGFQLTARFKDGGTQAGTLGAGPDDAARLGIETQAGIQYAGQRREGATPAAPGSARWSLVWIAPQTPGPVVFHVAANAANADETVEGDFVYTAAVESAPGQ
jgi:hypothetical protein